MLIDPDKLIIEALDIIAAERQIMGAKPGASINFAMSNKRVMCRIHGSRTFTGYGLTPQQALKEAVTRVAAHAKKGPPK